MYRLYALFLNGFYQSKTLKNTIELDVKVKAIEVH